eukprot:TRINITY_DN49951_c0_g1_i1.p1 TRINITY_DN49951_c0_g1~~TRINITY_DN49951_c0_g1_i1.p1  ORF type:complete len:949 (-),score=169.91 TRINITY_DN49951_c0_g1_i1:129-2975(-)
MARRGSGGVSITPQASLHASQQAGSHSGSRRRGGGKRGRESGFGAVVSNDEAIASQVVIRTPRSEDQGLKKRTPSPRPGLLDTPEKLTLRQGRAAAKRLNEQEVDCGDVCQDSYKSEPERSAQMLRSVEHPLDAEPADTVVDSMDAAVSPQVVPVLHVALDGSAVADTAAVAAPASGEGIACIGVATQKHHDEPRRQSHKQDLHDDRKNVAVAEEMKAHTKGQVASKHTVKRSRPGHLCEMLKDALAADDVAASADHDGFISITKVFRLRRDLQRDANGNSRLVVQSVEAQEASDPSVCLDENKRRVRLRSKEELVYFEAERRLSEASISQRISARSRGFGNEISVPLSRIVAAESLRSVLANEKDPTGFVRETLGTVKAPAVVRGSLVFRRPRADETRRIAEELFSDRHISQDSRLRAKVTECAAGGVPLTWLCSRYADHLGLPPPNSAQDAETTATEVCKMLRQSEVLCVDLRRLTISRRESVSSSATQEPSAGGPAVSAVPGIVNSASGGTVSVSAGGNASLTAAPSGHARALAQLRQLLDFYFEPFTLQNNRYLLDLVARRVGPPAEAGPWVAEEMLGFTCAIEELAGLGRVASAQAKLGGDCTLARDLGDLKHLQQRADGKFQLRTPFEVRSFVAAREALPGAAASAVRYLSAAREQRGQAPMGVVSVLSYAVDDLFCSEVRDCSQRRSRLKRQLVVHHADIICLQGLNPNDQIGEGIAATLSEEGYTFAWATSGGEANAIFWDRCRWERIGTQELGAALAVVLRPFEDPSKELRAVCFRPDVPLDTDSETELKCLFGGDFPDASLDSCCPVVVCCDMTRLGGAEGASAVEALAGLPSAAFDVLGEEVACPVALDGNTSQPARMMANGLNRLHAPDAILYGGMSPVAVLSGHTEGYLATMLPDDVLQQLPAFRLPLVAAFDWRRPYPTQNPPLAPSGKILFRI